MPGRADELIRIPASLWHRAELLDALRGRDIGRLFPLVHQYTGSQPDPAGIACLMPQPKVSGIIRGTTGSRSWRYSSDRRGAEHARPCSRAPSAWLRAGYQQFSSRAG